MTRATLRLTLDVTYELNDTPINDLVDNLLYEAGRMAADHARLTDTGTAVVVVANPNVERLS